MATPSTLATPSPTVGQEVKAFFAKIGHALETIGTDTLKAIGAANKEIPIITPVLNATLQEIFPATVVPAQAVEKIIGACLSAASNVATALQNEGLNPSLDETAAVTVAGVIHSLGVKPTSAIAPIASS